MGFKVNKSPMKPRPNGNPPPQKPSPLLNTALADALYAQLPAFTQEQAAFERAIGEVMALTGLTEPVVRRRLYSFCAKSPDPWHNSYRWLRAKLMRGDPVEW
jgi:hypothetical protein